MKGDFAPWASFDIGCDWATFGKQTPAEKIRDMGRPEGNTDWLLSIQRLCKLGTEAATKETQE